LGEELAGEVTHFFGKINVGIVKLSGGLKNGDSIAVRGHGADFTQKVESMEINREAVEEASAGQEIGLRLSEPAKEGCKVYRITE
jgi:translation elongation factor EF-Tu-like GTPase